MSSIGSELKYALGISALVSFYGIASLLVWFVGPEFGMGYAYQIIIIALLLLTLPFVILINYYRKRRAAAAEAAAAGAVAEGATEAPPAGKKGKGSHAPTRVYEELASGAEEAVQWLRSSRLGGKKSSEAVYALPWFMIAGPPASGKSTLLLSSGFDFQTLPSQRSAEQHLVRPTRSCEWRVTDSALLLDTTGRYQTEGPARDEWAALAETIKKYRQNRPLDGLLVAVNTRALLMSNETEIEQQAKILRGRLDEILHSMKMRFPVYLIFTEADAVEGFQEFFRAFNSNGRAQVWGATIPLEKSMNAHALFDAEFDLLYDALMRKRLMRLSIPEQPADQLRIFDFPFRFGEARSKLGLFTSALFRPNPFSESPLLRGFYFTASLGTGEAKAAQSTLPIPADEGSDGEAPSESSAAHSVGKAFFTHRFFKEVLLRDKDLAASFQAAKKKPIRLRSVLLAVAALLLVLLTAGMVVSFFANRSLVLEARERGERVDEITRGDIGKDPASKSPAEARIEIEAVDQLRETLAQLDDYNRNSPPFYMRFGLYSGNNVMPALRTIYFDSVEQRFKKPTVAALERDLRAFAAGNPTATVNAGGTSSSSTASSSSSASGAPTASAPSQEDILGRHYDLLKAYLMLGQPERVEPTFLASQLADYWKKFSPSEMETASQLQLNFFARQIASEDAPHIKVDDKLVAQVRQKLAAYPAVNRFYKRLTTEINAQTQPVSLDSVLEGRNRGILVGVYTVPGSYTIEGYREHVRPKMETAAEEISKEDWVMGSTASEAKDQSADIGKLQNMYFRDYADQWRKFVRGISVREYKSKDDAVEALKAFSSSDSPMERVAVAVEHHTNFSAKPKSTSWWGWFKSFFTSSESEETGGASEPEKEFRPLIKFAAQGGKTESTPLTQYRAALRSVLDPLEGTSQSQLEQTSKALLTGKDELGLQKAEQQVNGLIGDFKNTSAGSDAALLLKQPLDNLRALLYGSGYTQIEKTWRDQIYPKARALESGFPFTDAGESSVTDLSKFLNPVNGQFTVFFNTQLAPSFEDVNGEWKLKESGAVKFSDDFVKYINNVRRLREALFPGGGQQPEVRYGIELQPQPSTDITVEIDGQRVETGGTKSASFVWPARPGSQTGGVIRVMQNSTSAAGVGATTTAGGASQEIPPKTFSGEWGLFKMFTAGSPSKTGENQFALLWNVGSVPVRATLRPSSATNPFNRSLFTSLHAPEALQKQ
ncbi:MAG TPA: type VI secretion system membrane subunit TssM [Pyrinomonadaceae bacterium]|jgi:type VI secretion system protein ImpL